VVAEPKSQATPDDFSWASYVYDGDPRVCLDRVQEGQPAESEPAPAPAGVAPESAPPEKVAVVDEVARDYETVREAEPPDRERTLELSKLVAQVAGVPRPAPAAPVVADPSEQREGSRIVTLGLLEATPDPS
jgi:hypothetical protein